MGKMNKDDANKMAQAVDNRIIQIAKQVYRQVPNDREVEGLVTAFDSRYNSYTVKINNKEYSAIPQERTLGPIDINTRVKVKIPNNQMSNAYICGIVDGSIKSNPYPLPLGMIIPSAIIQNDAGLHLLDGSELAIGGTYDAFCQFILNNISKVATCTAADYQTEMTTYGQCGKFVITSTYVKLPTITKFIEGLSDVSNLGESFSAGLPNITGKFGAEGLSRDTGTVSGEGALYSDSRNYSAYGVASYSGSVVIGLDASLSNSIYGNSTTVQPQSTKFPYYIVVGTVVVKEINIDINAILSDLQNKADRDLGNVTYPSIITGGTTFGSGDRVIEQYMSSDGKTWYRKWASGWKECGITDETQISNSTRRIILPIAFSNTNYTIVCTGHSGDYTTAAVYITATIDVGEIGIGCTGNYHKGFRVYCCGY